MAVQQEALLCTYVCTYSVGVAEVCMYSVTPSYQCLLSGL